VRLTPAILPPEGHDAEAIRHAAPHRFNVSLGGGLGALGDPGDLNEPMLLGALTVVEMALRIDNVLHGRGDVDAAMGFLSA
jgi:alanine-glyoxylate transaminase / serine-glyoxylate transaminase / serine-pyruvate transaminase